MCQKAKSIIGPPRVFGVRGEMVGASAFIIRAHHEASADTIATVLPNMFLSYSSYIDDPS